MDEDKTTARYELVRRDANGDVVVYRFEALLTDEKAVLDNISYEVAFYASFVPERPEPK